MANKASNGSKNNQPILTTGAVGKAFSVAPRTVTKWVDQCIEQYAILKKCPQRLKELRILAQESPDQLNKKQCSGKPLCDMLKAMLIDNTPAPYVIADSKDRRIPRDTAIALATFQGNSCALEMFSGNTNELTGVIFASGNGSFSQQWLEHLPLKESNIVCTQTAVDTVAMMHIMKKQNGTFPNVVMDANLGTAELKALATRFGQQIPIIAIIGDDQQPAQFSHLPFSAIFQESEVTPTILAEAIEGAKKEKPQDVACMVRS